MCGCTGKIDLMGYYVTTYSHRKHQGSWVSWWAPADPVLPWLSLSLSNFVAKLLKSSRYTSCLHCFTSPLLPHLPHHASVCRPALAENSQWSPTCQHSTFPPCVGWLGSMNYWCSPRSCPWPSAHLSATCALIASPFSLLCRMLSGAPAFPLRSCWASHALHVQNRTH